MRLKTAAFAVLRVLTLNAAGIPFVHPGIAVRMPAIAARIKAGDYDVVGLQEVWRDRDAQALAQAAGLAYSARFFHRLAVGTGLAILSRYPILETHEIHFSCTPSIFRVTQGEALAGKGALMARVKTPKGDLDVYDVHFVSDYPDSRYFTLRLTQVFELSEAMERWSAGRPVLLLGDLNAGPADPEYRILVDLLGLDDACLDRGTDHCGITDAEDNKRLDHVLLPQGTHRIAAAQAFLTEAIPGTTLRYSDHDGVAAVIGEALLRRRLAPEARPRLEALMRVETAVARMVGEMYDREHARSWIPLYGFVLSWRYDRQIARLQSVRGRVESARILTLEQAQAR